MLQLFNHKLLLSDNRLDQIPDRNYAHHLALVQYRQVAHWWVLWYLRIPMLNYWRC